MFRQSTLHCVQQPPKARRPAAKRASPLAADRPENGTANLKREDNINAASPGQALRSGRHRALPTAAARQPSPHMPATAPAAEQDAAKHGARRDGGMPAEQEKPPQPPAGHRPRRPARLAGNKRSLRAPSAGDDEEEEEPVIAAEAAAAALGDDEEEAQEATEQAADRRPARLLRPRRPGARVPASEQQSSEGKAVGGSESDEDDDGEAAGVELEESPVPEDLTRRPASRRAYPYQQRARRSSGGVARSAPPWRSKFARRSYPAASPSPSADEDGDTAGEPDEDTDNDDDQAPHAAPDASAPSHFPGEAF